ncbi:hypothetical protein [Tateyamaria sp. SN3-11]|uniref:hypothetical protein n=1 Tax=Tateyamaria sp. SN3-11 TaxID=3092147 RepID=UPI0039E9BA72
MRFAALFCAILAFAAPVRAQDGWPNLDALLFSTLTASGQAEASFWLPDTPDPATATRALGVVYEHIPGSAGSVSIATGVYVRTAQGWQIAGVVPSLFGQSPRGANFGPASVDLTTTTLGPNEARCCPTVETRWRIDLTTFIAQRLN